MQAFCGYEKFVTEEILDPSTLTKMRERLGLEFFKKLERKTYKLLIDRKIIKAKGMLVDATVFPEEIKCPNDVGLLNDVRQWLVRNIRQLKDAIEQVKAMGQRVKQNIIERLHVVEKICHQQMEMYRRKVNRIEDRIKSFHRPYVRPIKRGKQGKKVEFGGKGALVQV